jgi:autotransporter-associated beta strand protein
MPKNPRSWTLIVLSLVVIGMGLHVFLPKSPESSPLLEQANDSTVRRGSGQTNPSPSPVTAGDVGADAIPVRMDADPQSGTGFVFPSNQDLPPDFIDRIVSGNTVSFTLPDGRKIQAAAELMDRDDKGVLFVQGRIRIPEPGSFFFQRQTVEGVAGPFVGNVWFHANPDGWKIEPTASLSASRIVRRKQDEIVCINYSQPAEEVAPIEGDVEHAPQTHPSNIAIPPHQTIIPLQSLPGAIPVIYLDFDGEKGPFPGWTSMTVDAAPANASNTQIYDVWKMVSEDFQGFNLNVTTDRKVFDSTPEGRRAHCIITPTKNAAPTAGGVAYVGSFNWTGDRVCWAYYSTGKNAVEVISHEVGHTLGLSHDGRTSPSEGYYGGHGTDPTGWAPIMGVGYYKKLSQWSKGEYLSANQKQDDLTVIDGNNDVAYRSDDSGDTLGTARYLEIASNNSVSNEGIIEKTGDIDSFRFVTAGGPVSITANPVSAGPNLDILAEIVDATTSSIISSANPDLDITATVTADLPAGEYLLRVRGTGRGDPLGDGYTNYGSLGAYLISGSVSGGLKPERFTISENSPNGSLVGTVIPRNAHSGATLGYAIASGNTGGAFTIDPLTGAITVSNNATLNYEALSLRWDDPATFELFVTINNPNDPSLNENLRTVITVANLNEVPTVTGGAASILENTYPGTQVFKVTGSDPDRFDFPLFSITAGNTGNVFSINSGTGQITVAANIGVSATTVYNLTVRATDKGSPALTSTANVAVTVISTEDGYQPGRIVRTYFEGITGSTVASLTGNAKFPNNPDSQEYLTSFDGLSHGDTFGSTFRGYLIPPTTGNYQFWIASNDASELRISSNALPANSTVRATVATSTNAYAWTTNTSQQSPVIAMNAGQAYYIEVRHKENTSTDHVAVAWSGPGISRQVISGIYLSPFYQNYAPKINTAVYQVNEDALAGRTCGTVTARDVNTQDTFSGYTITGGNTGGVFGINPATGQLFVAQSGILDAGTVSSYTLTIRTSDNGTPSLNGSGTVTVNVLPATAINLTGIAQEIWTGITGSNLSSLTGNANYPNRPNVRRTLASFDSGAAYGDSYGSRIRAKFIVPTSGDYTFHIAGDDVCQLLFSSNEAGTGATQIANVASWTDANEWTKFTTQTSTVRTLVAGQAVYLEARLKENTGGDHVSVGYTGPGMTAPAVIPGTMLQPFNINSPPVVSPASYIFNLNGPAAIAGTAVGTVTATEPNAETLLFAITSGNGAGSFAINSSSGAITVANPGSLTNGDVTLQVTAQDGGLGGVYPFGSASASVIVRVTGFNTPPTFTASSFSKPNATEDIAYNQTIAGSATDANAGDTLTYSKTGGPSWLSVAANGALSGTPLEENIGVNSFNVQVTDAGGLFSQATLSITVIGVNEAPSLTSAPSASTMLADTAYTASASATDPDTGDSLTFSKASGPSWVSIAANGSISGTPALANVGTNNVQIRVTDAAGLFSQSSFAITVIASPTWTNATGGNWQTSSNWLGGIVGNGNGLTANFSSLNLSAQANVSLNEVRTLGHLLFGDTVASHNWVLNPGSAGSLHLATPSGAPSITVNNQSAVLNIPISGSQGLVKAGNGNLVLSGANAYSGDTLVSAGSLTINGTHPSGPVTITPAATLAGTGTISGPVTSHGKISPGVDGPGLLRMNQSLGLGPDSSMDWQISHWTDIAGTGYDSIAVGSLNITATSSDPVVIRISSTALAGFTETGKTFKLIDNAGTTTGFDAADFTLDDSAFTQGSGTWSIEESDSDLLLVYTRSNTAPEFSASPILLSATEDLQFSGSVSAEDGDSGEILTYSIVSGPEWLSISSSGLLSGMPSNSDVGTNIFGISVIDSFNVQSTASLVIDVANANDAPVFILPTIITAAATQDVPYLASIAGSAVDQDSQDTLTYNRISGPEWLQIATDGALSGKPLATHIGPNQFSIRVTDAGGLSADALLTIDVIANPLSDGNDNSLPDIWESDKFGNANPGSHPADEDADGDGLSNLMEFALDTHPALANASPLLSDFMVIGPDSFLCLTIPKSPLAAHLEFTVEVCDNIATGIWSTTPTVIVSETPSELIVRDAEPVGTSTNRFLRLKVRTPP